MEQLQLPGIETGPTEADNEEAPAVESGPAETEDSSIPDKFRNEDGSVNVDSLLKSYTELEKSKNTSVEKEKPTAEAAPIESQTLTANEALHISDELAANGEISDKTYGMLKSKGLSKEMSDQYLDGQRALAAKMKEDLWEPVGGEKTYNAMLEWAVDNMTPTEVASYDKIMIEGDMATKQLTVQGLAARYRAENPSAPKLMSGNVGSRNASNAFESWAQVTEAMRDPRYDKDEAYRSKIEARLAISNF